MLHSTAAAIPQANPVAIALGPKYRQDEEENGR
jgi:hypothetical protein